MKQIKMKTSNLIFKELKITPIKGYTKYIPYTTKKGNDGVKKVRVKFKEPKLLVYSIIVPPPELTLNLHSIYDIHGTAYIYSGGHLMSVGSYQDVYNHPCGTFELIEISNLFSEGTQNPAN